MTTYTCKVMRIYMCKVIDHELSWFKHGLKYFTRVNLV